MLFLHEEVQLVEAVEGGSIVLVVVVKRFTQAQEGDTAFMPDFVGHGAKVMFEGIGCEGACENCVFMLFSKYETGIKYSQKKLEKMIDGVYVCIAFRKRARCASN